MVFPGDFPRKDKKRGLMISHLIRFLHPEEVLMSGGSRSIYGWLAEQYSSGSFRTGVTDEKLPFHCRKLLLLTGELSMIPTVHPEDVWIFPDLNIFPTRQSQEKMMEMPGITVSVKAKNMVILFFHPVLMKQHYVIKGWFYL